MSTQLPSLRLHRVWFRVAGPHLPSVTVTIGKFTIGPKGSRRIPEVLESEFDLGEQFSGFSNTFSPRVVGDCYAYVDVMAKDASSAYGVALENEVPVLVSVLSLNEDSPYHVVPILAADGSGESFGPTSGTFIFWDESELDSSRASELNEIARTFGRNKVAKSAAQSFAHAVFLEELSPVVEVRSAVVMNYFKVIEVISQGLPQFEAEDADVRREEVIRDLRVKLDGAAVVSTRVKAVRSARDALARIDESFTGQKISAASTMLSLGGKWESEALRLARFRNRELGHGGSYPSPEALADWIESGTASMLARGILRAYIERPDRPGS